MHDRFLLCLVVFVLFVTMSISFSVLLLLLTIKKAGFLTFI